MFAAYLAGLFIVVPLAVLLGSLSLVRSAGAVFYNWCVNQALVFILQDYTPWYAFAAVDTSCLVLLVYWTVRERHGWPAFAMALLWLTYAAQIFMHFGFHYAQNSRWAYAYWQLLTVFAFAQLVILAIWTIGGWLSRRGKRCA